MQRFLKNKSLTRLTVIVYILSIAIIFLIMLGKSSINIVNVQDIYEKKVNFFNVFYSNISMILKMYILGLVTIGIYALFSWTKNIIALGLLVQQVKNSEYSRLIYKLVPHGMFEYLGISLCLSTILYLLVSLLMQLPNIIKGKVDYTVVLKKNALILMDSVIINILIFFIAGMIEFIISYIKFL